MKNKRLRLLALALTATMALGACGPSEADEASDLPTLSSQTDDSSSDEDANDGDSDGELSEADQEKAMAEYESCMADAGVDIGSFIGGDSGGAAVESIEVGSGEDGEPLDFEAFETAAEACDQILEDAFGSFEMTPEQEAEAADQMLEMQRCLSEAGFDINLDDNAFELDENVDFEAFEEAMSSCSPDFETGVDQ